MILERHNFIYPISPKNKILCFFDPIRIFSFCPKKGEFKFSSIQPPPSAGISLESQPNVLLIDFSTHRVAKNYSKFYRWMNILEKLCLILSIDFFSLQSSPISALKFLRGAPRIRRIWTIRGKQSQYLVQPLEGLLVVFWVVMCRVVCLLRDWQWRQPNSKLLAFKIFLFLISLCYKNWNSTTDIHWKKLIVPS